MTAFENIDQLRADAEELAAQIKELCRRHTVLILLINSLELAAMDDGAAAGFVNCQSSPGPSAVNRRSTKPRRKPGPKPKPATRKAARRGRGEKPPTASAAGPVDLQQAVEQLIADEGPQTVPDIAARLSRTGQAVGKAVSSSRKLGKNAAGLVILI